MRRSSTLGRAGGREQLRVLFSARRSETRRAIVRGLFLARDDDGLIPHRRAGKGPRAARPTSLSKLRLLGTPKAKAYLESVK